MIRRIIETLIIECYEYLKRETEIKDSSGNYFMLNGLISVALDTNGLSLGRETKKYLKTIKELGDRSAHNRRYNAIKPDIDSLQQGVRIVVEDLINIS